MGNSSSKVTETSDEAAGFPTDGLIPHHAQYPWCEPEVFSPSVVYPICNGGLRYQLR